jgi:hypothetical protein
MGEGKPLRICPRCGRPYDWVERRRVKTGLGTYRYYYYAVHLDRETKRREVCYLGPVDGYSHGAVTHQDVGGLEGLDSRWERNLSYLENLLESFTTCSDPRYVRKAVELVTSMLQRLQLHLRSLERTEEVKPVEEWVGGDEWAEKWRRLAELTPRRLDLEFECVIRRNQRACEELEELRPEFCRLAEELELNLVFCQKRRT